MHVTRAISNRGWRERERGERERGGREARERKETRLALGTPRRPIRHAIVGVCSSGLPPFGRKEEDIEGFPPALPGGSGQFKNNRIYRSVLWFRGGLVFEVHRLVYHSI